MIFLFKRAHSYRKKKRKKKFKKSVQLSEVEKEWFQQIPLLIFNKAVTNLNDRGRRAKHEHINKGS